MSAATASTLQGNRALCYTPGTLMSTTSQNGGTRQPPSTALGQSPQMAPTVPIVAVLLLIAALLFLEHRRIRLGGHR
jgi:hypothetical protein